VFDVYRSAPHHVVLVDFNPFCRVTDPLLFTWDELGAMAGTLPELRVIEDRESIKGHPYAANRVPQDIVAINNQQDINDFVSMFNNGKLSNDSEDEDL